MDDIAGPLLIGLTLMVFAGLGVLHVAMDFRHFSRIVEQCKTDGYIQNDKIRVLCKIEEKK